MAEIESGHPEASKQFTDLPEFQAEIERLKIEEKEAGKTVHLLETKDRPEIIPANLTEEDMQAFNDLLAERYDPEKFNEYRHNIALHFQQDRSDLKTKNRLDFVAFLANKWMSILNKKS
ncbi:MAG TPA: hypothetical protein VJJ80_03250 [Patescibacteria group bacterium]|nr:hypothetical protein [Patescibacteria group bacterium]